MMVLLYVTDVKDQININFKNNAGFKITIFYFISFASENNFLKIIVIYQNTVKPESLQWPPWGRTNGCYREVAF